MDGATDRTDRRPSTEPIDLSRRLPWRRLGDRARRSAGARRLAGARARPCTGWQTSPTDEAFTDDERIFLPRRLTVSGQEISEAELLRLTALLLATRIVGGAVAATPPDPFARDVHWATEAARADRRLADEFPGLAAAIVRARELALRERPRSSGLSLAERAVEEFVRRLLESPLDRAIDDSPAVDRPAGPYRGMATVLHWGTPRPDLVNATVPTTADGLEGERESSGARHRKLGRRVEAVRSAEEVGARSGPFILPFGDPKQAIEDAAGLRRPVDRDETIDLDALGDEMERLGKLPTIRSALPAREVLETVGRLPRRPATDAAADVAIGIRYPEWDYRADRYRPGYCTVSEAPARGGDLAWSLRVLEKNRRLRDELSRRFERLRPRRLRLVRQLDGDELDLDAYVEDFADRRAGRSPSERLYVADPARRRDVSVALLIDASASTDAWVDGTRAVVDVEKEAALVFGSMLERLGDRHAIFAFPGRGPRNVRVSRLKDFAEPSGESVKRRIASVSPDPTAPRRGASPRRFATLTRTAACPAAPPPVGRQAERRGRNRRRSGIEDTAPRRPEARLEGLSVFCLTIDREGPSYLPHVFGVHGYAVAAKVAELPERLSALYRSIT